MQEREIECVLHVLHVRHGESRIKRHVAHVARVARIQGSRSGPPPLLTLGTARAIAVRRPAETSTHIG